MYLKLGLWPRKQCTSVGKNLETQLTGWMAESVWWCPVDGVVWPDWSVVMIKQR